VDVETEMRKDSCMRFVLGAVLLVGLLGCQKSDDKATLESQSDSVSYSVGHNIGKNLSVNLKRDSVELSIGALVRGLKDALGDTAGRLMTDQQMQETMMAFQQRLAAKEQAKQSVVGEKNLKEGESFLAENKKKKGVVTLPSGLQYEVITEGKGVKPKAEQTVTTQYRGTLIDGTEFDSSYKRGQPAIFMVNGVIPGWIEALQLMRVGSKWKLYIPSNLAYGAQGAQGFIGPNAALIFELELLDVK